MDWKRKSDNEYIREGRKRTQWYRIAACLAALTMVCTGYLLIMPAATMEKQDISEQQAERQESDLSELAVKTVGLSEDTEGSEWLEKLPESLTGDWNTDLAATAQSQIGYTESDTDYVVDEGGDICGATLYGEWYGDKYGQWNDMFLSFCLYYAGIPDEAVSWKTEHAELDYLKIFTEIRTYKEMETYSPEIGDVAFYQDGRVGIVSDTGEDIRIVSGDADGVVIEDINPELIGFGSLSETENLYNTETSDELTDAGESGNGQQIDGTGEDLSDQQPDEADSGSQGGQTDGAGSSPSDEKTDGTDNSPDDQTGSADNSLPEQQTPPANTLDDGTDVQEDSGDVRNLEDYVMTRGFNDEEARFSRKLLDANGQEVEPVNGVYQVYEEESYTFNIRFYAPLGIPEAGTYVYQLPKGITASGIISEEVTADDGTVIGHLSVSEDGTCVILDVIENTKIRLRCSFEVYLIFEKEEGLPISSEIEFITDEDEKGTIEKYGEINEDGNVEWTITARIPGYSGVEYQSWSLSDRLELVDGDTYLELYKGDISITYGSEKITLTAADAAGDEDYFAYYWDAERNRLYLVSKRDSHEDCTGNTVSGLPEGWCTDWALREDSVLTIKFVDKAYNLKEAQGLLHNEASLFGNGSRVDAEADVEIPSVIEKSSGSTGQFTITVNPGYVDLSEQQNVLIRDTMDEHLYYQRGSLEIVAEDEDKIQQVLTYGTDYTLNVSENMNNLEIEILHPGKYKYTITYNVLIEGTDPDQEYNNTATVNVFGYEFSASDSGYGLSSGAEEYTVSVVKTEEDTGEIVPGAEYGLYSSNGELLLTGTTDDEGRIVFKGDPSAGVMLASGYLYYLQEIEAPEHYELSDTRYWFYYEGSDIDVINELLSIADFEGIYRESDMAPVEIAGNGTTDNTVAVQDRLIQYELPETGGSGTKMYTIMGIVLIWGATCVLYKKMRDGGKQNEKN